MTRYPLYRRCGRPQGHSGRVRKISPPPEFDPQTIRPVASRHTDCTIPVQECSTMLEPIYFFLIPNYFRVLKVVFFWSDSPESEFYLPPFRNNLFHLHWRCKHEEDSSCLHRLYKWNIVAKCRHIKFGRQGITQIKNTSVYLSVRKAIFEASKTMTFEGYLVLGR